MIQLRPVAVAKITAQRLRQKLVELFPRLWREVPDPMQEPIDLIRLQQKDAAQREAQTRLWVRLGIRQRKRRTPRPAEHVPLGYLQHLPQLLDIADEMRGRVVSSLTVRSRTTRPTLVEQHDPVILRIEEAAMLR